MDEYEIQKGSYINKSQLEEHRMFKGLKKNECYVLKHTFEFGRGASTAIVYHSPSKEKCLKWVKRK